MAFYTYKRVRELLPPEYTSDEAWQKKHGREYDGDGNYDGDQWIATEEYILDLLKKIETLQNIIIADYKGKAADAGDVQ